MSSVAVLRRNICLVILNLFQDNAMPLLAIPKQVRDDKGVAL
jgi:hypothetical protein